jgi:hypothetical protein
MRYNPINAPDVWFAVSSALLRLLLAKRNKFISSIRINVSVAVIVTPAVNLMPSAFLKY